MKYSCYACNEDEECGIGFAIEGWSMNGIVCPVCKSDDVTYTMEIIKYPNIVSEREADDWVVIEESRK